MNVFLPIYYNLENEFNDLSNIIHFDDKQLGVYSPYISNLIVRCAIEVEALSKEIYFLLNPSESRLSSELFFDTDCINWLDTEYNICSKVLSINATNFYFTSSNKLITPLKKCNKRGSSSSLWLRAYQGLKHDRKNNLPKGNLKNLIYALGSLYILNIYYKFFLEDMSSINDINSCVNSSIFYTEILNGTVPVTPHKKITDKCFKNLDNSKLKKESIIVKVFTADSVKSIEETYARYYDELLEYSHNSPKIQEYLKQNAGSVNLNMIQVFYSANEIRAFAEIHKKFNLIDLLRNGKTKIILCKNGSVYNQQEEQNEQ